MRVLFTCLLIFALGFSSNVKAQNFNPDFEQNFFIGCPGECFQLVLNGTEDFQGTYLWTIIPQASQDTMIFTTDFPVLDLCNVEFGPYFIEVTGLGFDGSIPFIHAEEFFFEVLDDFFFIDIFPITPSDCHDAIGIGNVCAGDTVTYSYELQSGTGGFPLFVEWFVEGDYVSYDVSNNTETVTVIWGESGVGVINLLAFTECFTNQEFFTVNIHPIPEPAFNTLPSATDGVLEICAGETVQFENITSNAESYLWDFGNGQTSTDENPSFTFNQSGTFDVSLTAYNQCFCSDITTLTVIVDEGETPLIDCVSTICAGTVSTYSTPNDCGTYLWDISDNGVIVDGGTSSDDFITVEWLDGPEGTLELTLEDCADPTACLATASIQVPIISATAVIDGPAIVCKGDQVTYSVPPYEGTTFNWSVTPFGTILDGQGTNSVTIEWFDGFEPSQTQVVSVSYDNCYLECGGSATLDVNFRPSFLASGPLEVCENGMNTYSAFSSLNNPASANWEVLAADGTSLWTSSGAAADQNIDWIWGSGTFTLIATPDNALDYCTPNYEIQVQVQPTPASADIDGPQSICPGSTYNYQAVNLPQGTRSRWVITNGSAQDTLFGHSINITWGNTPPYELSLVQITNDFLACESPSTDMSLQLIQNFAINGPIDVCLDQIELFTSTYYADLSYEWTISPASAGTITGPLDSNQIEILWHEAGPASISLNVCGQTEAFNVNVLPLPEPVVSHPADLCPNETAVVQTNTNFASYTWFDEGGSVISTVAQPNVGPGYYRVQVEDQNGCVGDTTFYINGYPNPKISITTPFPNGYCGTIPMITLYAVDSEGGYTYQWFRDGNPVGTDSPTFTTNQLGSYYVQVTDQNGCQSISNSIPIYDCCASGNCGGPPSPNPGCTGDLANFDIQNTSECNVHNYLNTSVNPVSGTFNWFFDDPASGADNFSNLDNPSHTFSNPGFYRIIMTGDMVNSSGDVVNCGIWKVDTVEVAADFEFDNACPGEAVAFFDISTYLPVNSIVGWVWDFGDPTSGNNISNMQDPTHTYMNPGTYTVELTVTANTGCTSTIQKDITIFPPPNISFNPPMSSCEDVALQFEAIADPSVTFVKWDFGDGSSGEANESELTPTFHRYETPGTYTVTLFAQSIYGCTNSFTQNITIEPNTLAGDISSTLPSPICEGDLSTLTAPAGAQSWLWSTGATTQSITVGESELYEVTITDADGCEYSPAPFQLDVLPAPEGEIRAYELDEFGQLIAYYYDNYSTCEGEDIFLETQNNTDYSFEWTNGDTEFETEYTDDRGNLLGVGNHDIFVTITDNQSSCSEVIGPLTITINPVPNNVTITADQPGLVCEGTSVTFSVDNPDPSYTYLWSNGSEGATMTTDISGTYFVTAVTPFGCEAESNRLDILDGPNISLVPGGCHYRCEPDTLCVPDIPGVISYQWYLDGNPIAAPEGTVPDLIATQSGSYTLEMTNADGCTLIADPIQLNLFPGFGDITGQVYSDVNNNGVIDAADTVLSNIPVLLNNNLDTIFTSIQGAYGFANIPADDYNLSIDINNLPPYYTVLPVQQDTAITTCDESIQLNFLIQIDCPVIERFENLSFCEGDSVIYNGVTYSSTTSFTNTLSNGFGCDSVVFVNIQELSSSDNTINLSACTGTTVDYNGNTLNPGTTTDFTFVNAVGCDSVVTVQVTELQPSSQMVELTACTGTTVDYNGNTLNPGTSTDFTLTNAAGCDSVVTVVVQELTPTTSMVELSSCTGSTVDYNGNALSPGTSTDFTFVNAAGCDSIVTVMVEELLPSTETIDLFACEGISIDYNGQAIMAGSQEIFQLTNAAGCDSTLTVNVISLQDFNVEVNLSACTGSSANYNGNMLAAGSQTDFVFTSAGGCDSTVTVIVEELVPTTAQIALSACSGTTADFNGNALAPGTSTDFTFVNAAGCDSTVTVTVAELLPTAETVNLQACSGLSADFNGTAIAAGTQQDFVISNAAGCDSTITVIVEELLPTTAQVELSACTGTTADFNGNALAPGTSTDFTFVNAAGCDSTVTVTVAELLPTAETVNLQACSGLSADFNGTAIAAGTQQDFVISNAAGCDSTITVIVEELLPTTAQVELSACTGTTADFNGNALAPGTSTDFTFVNAAGCDSTVTVTVAELLPTAETVNLQACSGLSADFNGTAIAAGTQQDFVISNAAGCDSTITVIVEELLPTTAQLELGACTGTTINFNGTTYQIGDQDQITLTNAVGCDSVIQLTVVELMPTSETLSFAVCAGESFDWNGSTIAAGSSQSFTLVNAVGCDSTLTIEVDELALPDFDYDISESCPSSSTGAISLQNVTGGLPPYLVSFDGGPFKSMNMLAFSDLPQGEYWVAIQDANGCTSEQLLSIDASEAIEIVAQNQVLECDQSQIMLDIQVLSGQTDSLKITWPDGSNGFTFMAMEAGSYPVSIQNECETITTSIEVSYPQGGLGDLVYIPNAFSPNDDGFNDLFRVEQTPGISFVNFKLHLFDRWGNQVFTTENPGEGWNGAYKSRVQNTGVYIWHLEADVQYCGRVIELDEKGDVVLMK